MHIILYPGIRCQHTECAVVLETHTNWYLLWLEDRTLTFARLPMNDRILL